MGNARRKEASTVLKAHSVGSKINHLYWGGVSASLKASLRPVYGLRPGEKRRFLGWPREDCICYMTRYIWDGGCEILSGNDLSMPPKLMV